MKKVFGIAALLLALAACNKIETGNQPVENTDGIPFSATVSLGDNAATKALAESGSTITATWAEGEKVALIHNGVSDEMTVSSVSGGSATITGTITSPADGEDVTIIYPSSAADGTTGNIKADLLYAQNGLLTGAGSISENYDARKGSGKLKVDGTATLDGSVSLTNQFAIFKFTVKNADASATIDVKPLTITIGTQDYVITPASATSTLYVALPAVSSQTVSFSATGSDSKIYTCSKDGVTFAAGNYYQSTLKMAKPAPSLSLTSPAVGEVIGSDGKNYAADASLPTGVTKVAMIAYVSGSNGLAIALADEGSLNWETAKSTCEAKTPAFTNGTWKLPSQDEWMHMFEANGGSEESYTGLNTAITTAGGTALQNYDNCWSSTPSVEDYACIVILVDGHAYWDNSEKDFDNQVRACLAF